MVYSLSARLQTHDFANLDQTQALVTDLEHDFAMARSAGCIVCLLNHHAIDEETDVFPTAARLESGLITQLIAEHHDLTHRSRSANVTVRSRTTGDHEKDQRGGERREGSVDVRIPGVGQRENSQAQVRDEQPDAPERGQ